ncbi:protein LATERAL BRANCHING OXIDOREDUCTASE 1-like [Rutidosis leptorrhynchoides]|uniref:protein LATERAL BRANCHING OXIDOREDUCTASE 1-like n=1 Tax=Rutidosis leptorrhynchoides TaxID=125765 RepID=UPI003A99E818
MNTPTNPSLIDLDKAALSKTVQEMAVDGDQPPSTYIVKEFKFGPLETSLPSAPIPIIDMSCFLSTSSMEVQEIEIAKLRSALTTWGCFQAVNHGISTSFIEIVRQVVAGFFQLPKEEKLKNSRMPGCGEGYGTDTVVSDKQVLDWSDRLVIDIFPESRRNPKHWPKNPSNFSETVEEYGSKIRFVMATILKAIAKTLNLEEDCFSQVLTEDGALLQGRFIYYPPCPMPDQVYGLKPHTDRSGMTVLLQDTDVQSLQVLNNDKWFMVPLIRDALFVNLGDQMQIMSNGIYKSPLHRVVTNPDKGKISIALLNEPNPNREIGPVEALINEERPRLYKNLKNYGFINYQSFQKGVVAIDSVKV